MKISLTIFTILIPILSFSQNDLEERIENLPIYIHSGCDTINHRTQWGSELGELDLEIKIVTARENRNKISITGIVQDRKTGEPLPDSEIFTATFQDDYCEIIQYLTTTDKDGTFKIEFRNSENLSLFFQSQSYRGLELKIGELKK